MSQEDRQVELRKETQRLLHGRLKHVRAAALAGALVPLAAVALSTAMHAQGTPSGGTQITLGDVTHNPAGFPSPAGIACQGPSGKLVTSVNGPSGLPNNFDLVDPATAQITQFSTVSGARGEIKIGAVYATPNQGGFAPGGIYAGNGVAGQILRLSSNGSVVTNPWVTLPGEAAPPTGLFQDRYGVAGGDFVVTTGNDQNGTAADFVGSVWRVKSSRVTTHLLDYAKHLEGVTTVPNDPVKYGPLAGQILAGDEDRLQAPERDGPACKLLVIDPTTGAISATLSTDDTAPPSGTTPANYHVPAPLCPEDIDVIPANAAFYGIDSSNNRMLSAPASDFVPFVGDILVTKEFPTGDSSFPAPHTLSDSGLNVLHWDATAQEFSVTSLLTDQGIDRWEHVTFAGGDSCGAPFTPAPGVSITKFTNGVDANDPNAAGVPNIAPGGAVTWTYRVTNIGNTSAPFAEVAVTDNTPGVTPGFTSEISGNGDAVFDPGEVWLYTATGTALDLTKAPPAGVHTVPNSCRAGGTQAARTAYTNIGMATIPDASAMDSSSYCNPPQPQACIPANSQFNLGQAAQFTVLYMTGANAVTGGDSTINGNVGVGPNVTGSMIKLQVNGNLVMDPTAHPSMDSNFKVSGTRTIASLSQAVSDALAANVALNALAPTQSSLGSIGGNQVVTLTHGMNVVPISSVNTHGVITINGFSDSAVVFKVAGGFTCNGCSVVLNSAFPQNVLWNLVGTGLDVSISKPVGITQGIFLAPDRNILLDKATNTGALMGARNGLELLIHSAATENSPCK